MVIFYHGTSALFDKFDLSHALEGDGKVKFGYGIYLSPVYKSAAHYSGSNPNAVNHYVYTVEIPEITEENSISFKHPVHPFIIKKLEHTLNESIPIDKTTDGKELRKYLAKRLTGKADFEAEKEASKCLLSVGVKFITWAYCWRNPSLGNYCAVLDENDIKIIRIEEVELDKNNQLIKDSQKLIKVFEYEFL